MYSGTPLIRTLLKWGHLSNDTLFPQDEFLACNLIPQYRNLNNMDPLVSWVRGFPWLYIYECIFPLFCVCVVFITRWQTGWVGTSTEGCPASPPRPSTVLRRQVYTVYLVTFLPTFAVSLPLLPSLRLLKIRVAVHFRTIALHSPTIVKVFSIVGWLVFTSRTDHKVRKLRPSPLSSFLSSSLFLFLSLLSVGVSYTSSYSTAKACQSSTR